MVWVVVTEKKRVDDTDTEFSRQLLLAQLTEMSQDWRHLDNRIETALNLYISVYTLIIGGAAVIYPERGGVFFLLRFITFASPVLIAYGFFTARRIKNATISRDRRQLSVNLIKLFFQERNPEIAPYLPVYVDTPEPLQSSEDKQKRDEEMRQFNPSLPNGIVYAIYAINSVLAGAAVIGLYGQFSRSAFITAVSFALVIMLLQWAHYTKLKQVRQAFRR